MGLIAERFLETNQPPSLILEPLAFIRVIFLSMKTQLFLIVTFTVLFTASAVAWTTRLYSDAEVVGRAELIVLARVKEGSIKKLMVDGGSSYEHHAILIMSRVIKGEFHEKELPITISYGLLPVSARQEKHMDDGDAIVRSRPEEPGESTRIYEDNPAKALVLVSAATCIKNRYGCFTASDHHARKTIQK